ncbi:ankyrin repeat-containing domain protein [Chytridium lagenaria]|nr:ankyrin repeat-containing domain protein [Chytridium lagenaria]
MSLLPNLASELVLAIFARCDIKSLAALSSTCSRFYSLSNDASESLPSLKRLVHLRYFGYLRFCLATNTPADKSGEWLAHAIADTRITEDVVFELMPDYGIFDVQLWKAQAGTSHSIRIIKETAIWVHPLLYAVLAGWVEGVKILLRRKTAVTDHDGHNRNILHIAAASVHSRLYRHDQDRLDADLLQRDLSYRLPLHYACVAGFPLSEELTNLMSRTPYPRPQGTEFQETLKAVVEHYQNTEGVEIYMHDPMNTASSLTPLHIAALSGHYGCVEYLLKTFPTTSDAVEGVTGPRSAITPLLMACVGGHKDIVKLLVDSGADVDGLGGNAVQEFPTTIQYAMTSGVNLSISSKHDIYPSNARSSHADIVTFLLERGANPNGVGLSSSISPLSWAKAIHKAENTIESKKSGAIQIGDVREAERMEFARVKRSLMCELKFGRLEYLWKRRVHDLEDEGCK